MTLSFNITLEILVREVRQEDTLNGIQIRKREVKLSLFEDDINLYAKNPKILEEKFRTNKLIKVVGFKINSQKPSFYIVTVDHLERKLRK